MADIYIEYLPATGNADFDLKAQQLIDLLRTYISEHDTSLATLETEISWTEVSSFSNSWVNYGGSYNTAGYCKDAFGFVHLRGLIKDGTLGSAAFNLPTGYRPVKYEYPSTNGHDGSTRQLATAWISTNGDVTPQASVSGVNAWFSLDGITFYAG
jgi:hypothetical protein